VIRDDDDDDDNNNYYYHHYYNLDFHLITTTAITLMVGFDGNYQGFYFIDLCHNFNESFYGMIPSEQVTDFHTYSEGICSES
jgi:hypothetical protein